MSHTCHHLLLIEDNPIDVLMIQTALGETNADVQLHVVPSAEDALVFLERRRRAEEKSRPDLILLDLRLPGKSGHEFLAEVKADRHLKQIPIIVLTSSQADRDISQSYDLHANCYLSKPVGFEDAKKMLQKVFDFWFSLAKLP